MQFGKLNYKVWNMFTYFEQWTFIIIQINLVKSRFSIWHLKYNI